MAKYDNSKFYWLQLKEDFFEEDAINWLEEQPNGKEYCLFYLKLCLKSLKTNGVMIRKVGELLVPYDCKKLGEITNTDVDTVVVAMQLLKQIGLIKVLENGELYITELQKMIGYQSIGAFKKQQQRLISGQKEDKCPPEIDIEIEKDIKIDNKKEILKKECQEIIDYLNEKAGTHFKPVDSNLKFIKARLKDYSSDDLKRVVDKKVKEWKGTDMQKYLCPETLFNATKFEKYINGLDSVNQKKSFNSRDYSTSEYNSMVQNIDEVEI